MNRRGLHRTDQAQAARGIHPSEKTQAARGIHPSEKTRGFTFIELMMVSTIMIMVMGVMYTFYINMNRIYNKGSKTLLQIQDAQNTLELMAREIRSAAKIVRLEGNIIVFQKYYDEPDRNKSDPVDNLNKIRVKTIHFKTQKDKKGYWRIYRKEDLNNFKVFSTFASPGLQPNIFKGWKMVKRKFVVYNHRLSKPNRVPIVEVRLEVVDELVPLTLFKKVFMPVPFGELPVISNPEWKLDKSPLQ